MKELHDFVSRGWLNSYKKLNMMNSVESRLLEDHTLQLHTPLMLISKFKYKSIDKCEPCEMSSSVNVYSVLPQ